MEKINLVELLKDCPKGMKLDCSIFENLEFDRIDKNNETYPIICRVKTSFGSYNYHTFTAYGCYSTENYSKCTIFPKGKITWEEFQRPFKDGDIAVSKSGDWIGIVKSLFSDNDCYKVYVAFEYWGKYSIIHKDAQLKLSRLATEEEKQKLFDAIKANSYKWNDETKTLEKLSQFKDGDVLVESSCIFIIQKSCDNNTAVKTYCTLYDDGTFDDGTILYFYIDSTKPATEEEKQKLFKAIKANGYHWNAETKTLEKLVKSAEDTNDKIVMAGIYFDRNYYADEVELHLNNYEIEVRDGKTYAIFKNQKPQFKDGDVISNGYSVAIFYKLGTPNHCVSPDVVYYHCYYKEKYCKFKAKLDFGIGTSTEFRYATEEEKQKLFQAIKDNGYRWNAETKTLEKLPRFKVGDKIQWKEDIREKRIIDNVLNNCYTVQGYGVILFTNQDEWELVPNKFDINTLKTFDRVLVRCSDNGYWQPQFFHKFRSKSEFPFECTYNSWRQCIPYEGNEHLSDTTNDCDEFYKIW